MSAVMDPPMPSPPTPLPKGEGSPIARAPERRRGRDDGWRLAVLAGLALALVGGAIFYVLKNKKSKPKTKGPTDLDDYDYGDDTGDEEEYENEDEPEKMETLNRLKSLSAARQNLDNAQKASKDLSSNE